MAFTMKLKGAANELLKIQKAVTETNMRNIEKSVKAMAVEMKNATPVDTGLAKASWNVVATGNKDAPYKVENTVPYIELLNAGSSKQAPPYFIEKIALSYGKPVGAVVSIKESPEVL